VTRVVTVVTGSDTRSFSATNFAESASWLPGSVVELASGRSFSGLDPGRRRSETREAMTARSHQANDVVEEVGEWLAGEFGARLPAAEIDRVIKVTRLDLESSIAPEELGEMLHRLGRARLQRILQVVPPTKVRIPRAR
jgi:hypothetical protein